MSEVDNPNVGGRRIDPGPFLVPLLGAVVVAITGLAIYVFASGEIALRALMHSSWTSGRVVTEAILELNKTQKALSDYQLLPSPERAATARLRFELLLSRIPLLTEGREAALVREVDGHVEAVQIQSQLIDCENQFGDLDNLDNDGILMLSQCVSRVEIPLSSMKRRLSVFTDQISKAEMSKRMADGLLSLTGVILCALILAYAAYHQTRKSNKMILVAKARARELTRQLYSFRNFANAMPSAIVVFEASGDILFANDAYGSLTGRLANGSETETLDALVKLIGATSTATFPQSAREDIIQVRDASEAGALHLQPIWAAFRWIGKPACILVLRDLTALRHSELALMRSAQFATLGEMSTAIAHEINQPLAVIRAAAQTAMKAIALDRADMSALAEKFRRVDEQVSRAKAITDHMRVYGRNTESTPSAVRVDACVQAATRFLTETFRAEQIICNVQVPDGPCMTWGHEISIEQALTNVLLNARDALILNRATSVGCGTVTVVMDRHEAYWRIAVTDNAGGIPPSILPKLFQPFVTTKGRSGGTGLGLSISYGAVKEMKGEMTARNVEGGARFDILLPCIDEHAGYSSPS